jgi:MFS family permease
MKSMFFGAVFLEHLNYAFLPQFVDQLVAAAGLPSAYTSTPFMAYYLCFALSLLPAGHFAQHFNPRPLIYGGLLLAGAGLMLLAAGSSFYLVTLARSLSGIGQGALFIGVQSYILLAAAPGKKTQGAAIIVLGYQGGMISGMAIGSLLVTYLGAPFIFVLSASIALTLALYGVLVIPVRQQEWVGEKALGITWRQLGTSVGRVARDLEFLKTMILVGVPAKAVLTGVIIFALPLILNTSGYRHEDIGQVIMIYAAAVIVASRFVSRMVDRTGRTTRVLFWGCVLSGLGLLLIDVDRWVGTAQGGLPFGTAALIIGVAVVGIAHGFVNAPVVTHVADSALAKQMGPSMVTATYRFLERAGHIAGPIIMGQLLSYFGRGSALLSWIGVSFVLFGLLFAFRLAPAQPSPCEKVSQT